MIYNFLHLLHHARSDIKDVWSHLNLIVCSIAMMMQAVAVERSCPGPAACDMPAQQTAAAAESEPPARHDR